MVETCRAPDWQRGDLRGRHDSWANMGNEFRPVNQSRVRLRDQL